MLLLTVNLYEVRAGNTEEEKVSERLIRVEEIIKSVDSRLSQRIDDTNKQIDLLRQDLRDYHQNMNQRFDDFNFRMLMFFLAIIAIIIWDRRSSLNHVYDKLKELQDRVEYLWDTYQSETKESLQRFKTANP
jgi:tetrahydromethanopterin S-methyltransferase subunit G